MKRFQRNFGKYNDFRQYNANHREHLPDLDDVLPLSKVDFSSLLENSNNSQNKNIVVISKLETEDDRRQAIKSLKLATASLSPVLVIIDEDRNPPE